MTLKNCTVCGGSKKKRGLGGMIKECAECKGIGKVKVDDADVVKVVKNDNLKKNGEPKKPMGRPKQKKEELNV